MKVLVAYDGTLQAKEALNYGIAKVRENGGELVALHVFNSGRFIDYDVFGAEDAGRREAVGFTAEAEKRLKETGEGIHTRVVFAEGNPEEETIDYARENRFDLLLCPSRYKSIIKDFRSLLDGQGRKTREDIVPGGSDKSGLSAVSHI